MSVRRCRTCKRNRPLEAYATPAKRSCDDCKAAARCMVCGGPGTLGNKTCKSAECLHAVRREAGLSAARATAARPLPKTKHCPACGQDKPRDTDHFYVSKQRPGSWPKLDSECKSCRRALQRDKYHSLPGRRERTLQTQARRREEIARRRRSDPEFDAAYRAQRDVYNRRYRDPAYRPQEAESAGGGRMPTLPVVPLMELVEAMIEREQRERVSLREAWPPSGAKGREAICEDLGIPARYLRAWINNEYVTVNFATADRILTRTGLNWWDVWSKEDYPEVHARLAA